MSATLTGYPDAFAAAPGNAPTEETNFHKLDRALRKMKKKNKQLKRTIKEQRAAEEKRIAEEKRNAEEAKNKEKPLFEKIVDAAVKAIPVVLTAIVTNFIKNFFLSKKECKCA